MMRRILIIAALSSAGVVLGCYQPAEPAFTPCAEPDGCAPGDAADAADTSDTTSGGDTDTVPPTGAPKVVDYDPRPHSAELAPDGTISVIFDRPMREPETGEVVVATLQVGRIAGDFSDDRADAISFTPSAPWLAGDLVQVTLRRNVMSAAADRLTTPHVFELQVRSAPGRGELVHQPTPVSDIHMRGVLGERIIAARLTGSSGLDLVVSANGGASLVLAQAGGGWAPATPLDPTLSGVLTAAVGDLDGDGHLDIVVTSGQNAAIYRGAGDGTFQRQTVPLPGTAGAQLLALGDVDGDGDLDVVAVAGEVLAVLTNNGDGTFPAPTATFAEIPIPFGLALGDLDRDGGLDLVVLSNLCCRGSAPIAVFRSDVGAGTWQRDDQPTGEGNQAMALADFDGDGFLDVAVATGGTGAAVRVHFNDKRGGLSRFETLSSGLVTALAAGDIDGDGWIDLFAGGLVFENQGAGIFDAGESLGFAVGAFGDVDGDGDVDVIALGADGIELLVNEPDP